MPKDNSDVQEQQEALEIIRDARNPDQTPELDTVASGAQRPRHSTADSFESASTSGSLKFGGHPLHGINWGQTRPVNTRPSAISHNINIEGTEEFHQEVNARLFQIWGAKSGQALIEGLNKAAKNGNTVTIAYEQAPLTRPFLNAEQEQRYPNDANNLSLNNDKANDLSNKRSYGRKGEGSNAKVYWNPTCSIILNAEGRPTGLDLHNRDEADVALFHEMTHGLRIVKGTSTVETGPEYKKANGYNPSTLSGKEELRVTGIGPGNVDRDISENACRKERGLPLRTAYAPVSHNRPGQKEPVAGLISIHAIGTPAKFGKSPTNLRDPEMGHAWIVVKTPDGNVHTYGAWSHNPNEDPENQPRRGVFENAERTMTEKNFKGQLGNGVYLESPVTKQQMADFYKRLQEHMAKRENGWSSLKSSSAVAADLFKAGTGHQLNNLNFAGISSPSKLKDSIQNAISKRPQLGTQGRATGAPGSAVDRSLQRTRTDKSISLGD